MTKKCRRCTQGLPHTFKHGLSAYVYHDCRCEICCAAKAEHGLRRYRIKHPIQRQSAMSGEQLRDARREWDLRYRERHRGRINATAKAKYHAELDQSRDRGRIRAEAERRAAGVQPKVKYASESDRSAGKRVTARTWRERNRDERHAKSRAYRDANRAVILAKKREDAKRNSRYLVAQANKFSERKKSLPAGTQAGTSWTAKEDRTVMRGDVTLSEIAVVLGRTYKAVAMRRLVLRRLRREDAAA